jgi:hypothetical protein
VAACVSYQVTSDDVGRSYLISPDHVAGRLRTLASESVGQLQSEIFNLAERVVKNLVFIAKVANCWANSERALGITTPTFPWIFGRLRRKINAEVALGPKIPINVKIYCLVSRVLDLI